MSKQKVWIDMTDLNVWSGHMTGVQRVVYFSARHFANSREHEARFFVFNEQQGVFTEIAFADVEQKIEQAREERAAGEALPSRRSLKQLLKSAPRAVVRRIPTSVKQRVPSEIKQGIKGGFRLGVSLLRRSSRALQRRFSSVPRERVVPVDFGKDSTVLVLGKSWDFPDLIPALGRLKQQQGFKVIHLIHDMIPVFQPHTFGPGLFEPYTKTMFEVCSLSDGLLAQSKATAADIKRFCKELQIPQPPIQVIRLGDEVIDIALPADEPSPDPRIVPGKFVLQVGTVEARKNHQLVYLAYREAVEKGIKLPPWVIVGSGGWLTGDLRWQMEHDPLVKDNIILLGGVSDRTKLWLFRNCRFTLYPSTYEGLGMPVGESLAYGKVCITSSTSSLPEAGGDLADQVSPYNTQALLDAMVRYMDDAALRTKEQEIVKHYKPATWDNTFRQIDAFVRSLR